MLKIRSADPFASLRQAADAALPRETEATVAHDAPRVPYGSEGAPTPLLLRSTLGAKPRPWIVRSSDGGERLLTRALRIGSASDNDWVLGDRYVSQRHVVLRPEADAVLVEDRSSRNGTFLNGVRIRHGELRHGGTLRLGETTLHLVQPVESGLIGHSPQMVRLREQLGRFAPSPLPVLVLGESGTGKELVAQALHAESGRRGPLVTVNCGALPRELTESELFGHERGAFTGAERRHLGCFGEAVGGTLFLDEIGELPLELQPRLLRALENRAIRPVGASREVAVDVRIVAATHRDLPKAVHEASFRQDLYYRLAGLSLELPPLRARRDDIVLLARHFVSEAATEIPELTMDEAELQQLTQADWLGNVRELKMAIWRAAHLDGPQLTARDVLAGPRRLTGSSDDRVAVRGRRLIDIERDVLTEVLRHAGGNQRTAAALLDLPKSSLSDRLRRLGIKTARAVTERTAETTSSLPTKHAL